MKGKNSTKRDYFGLTHQQRLFADEYLVNDGHGRKAAEKAGYKAGRPAEVAASRLLKNPNIQAYLASKTQKIYDKYEITQERVMLSYARLAFYDPRKFYNEDGTLKEVTELDDDTAEALLGMEIERKGFGTLKTTKIKMPDRKGALDSICRVKGWNAPEKKDITTNGESIIQEPDLSGLTDEELRLLAKIKRKMNVEHL